MDDQKGFDPRRRLCPDGACPGVLSGAGRCGECGRVTTPGSTSGSASAINAGDPAAVSPTPDIWDVLDASDNAAATSAVNDGAATPSANDGAIVALTAVDRGGDPGSFDPKRRLCQDGACVGVVGPDGACLLCGRRAA